MTDNELIEFWKSVDVDGRRIEQLYVLILQGIPKEKAFLRSDDESKAWDVIAEDVKNNQPEEGSIIEIPNFN